MRPFDFTSRFRNPVKNEDLREFWESGKPIQNTDNVRYVGDGEQQVVIKKVKSQEDLEKHVSFYHKVMQSRIRTPRMLSKDRRNSMLKYRAVGIGHGEEGVWSKTLVNFEYDPDKEEGNTDFLVRVIEYALKEEWTDLHSGNILFDNGYLYLIDYVPGSGRHKIGSFGLQKIKENEKVNLERERFDRLLEKALNSFPKGRVSYCGLDFLRS